MSTSPAEVPPGTESPADRPGTTPERSQNAHARVWPWVLSAIALLIVIILFVASRSKTPAKILLTASTTQTSGQVLRLKGTTEAVQSRGVIAPMIAGQQVSTLTIVRLASGGARVKKGDLLVEFDRQAQIRDYIDKKAEYEKLVNQVAGEQAKESAARAKDETELKTAEDSLKKAEFEIQKSEISSRIDAEKKQEDLEEAKATDSQLRETFDLKRKAAQAGIRILEIQRDRTQQTMLHAQANADLMQIHSPIDGVVVLNTIWKEGTMGEVQEGDKVRPGVPFMQVVNPAQMQVRVLANQQDFPALQVGQTATVRLDAYPGMILHGKLDQVSPIGVGGDFSNKVRAFVVIVSIEGNDPKLMPDLSAAVDVEQSMQHNAHAAMAVTGGGGS
jgi:multidrug efflux pump subunit AcrA (membrane-fusion protein)